MIKTKIDKEKLLQKFKSLSVTSICIQKTSKYLYQYYKSSDVIVNVWVQALNSVDADSGRISLFYIANEMLQSKNYGNNYFKESWKPHLAYSIDCIKESCINDKIRRILNIWIERRVYEKPFIDDLINRLSVSKSPVINDEHCKEIIMNFNPEEAMEKLKELITVENTTLDILKQHEQAMTFDEKLCKDEIKKLKDKSHCHTFSTQLDGNINHLFQICTALEDELRVREKAFEAMSNAEIYYETQKKETVVVEDAYRRYGNLILKTKDVLNEHLDFLMDDGCPVDLDDAPSPGNTPPHLYEDAFNSASKDSPSSYDIVSPSQSMDMSEDDTPIDKSNFLDRPYSPSSHIPCSKPMTNEPKTSLSSTEALQLLTSVFSQSLTKKPFPDVNAKVNLQSDIFRNTLTTPVKTTSGDTKPTGDTEQPPSVITDAFRLISNLTGYKHIGERTPKSDPNTTSGANIPTLTSKSSFSIADASDDTNQNAYPFNANHFPTSTAQNGTVPNNIPSLIYPDMNMTQFQSSMFNIQSTANNQIFPIFNNASVPPPPIPGMYNNNSSISFNLTSLKQNNQQTSQSPGSCTEDEDDGGATPTQDEPVLINSIVPPPTFSQNPLPGLAPVTEDINKHIQNALNPFCLATMHPGPKDGSISQMVQSPWNNMPGQFPFTMNNATVPHMTMPFSMMNQTAPIQPQFIPANQQLTPTFGPPRAIRTKRPTADCGASVQDTNIEVMTDDSGSISSQTPPPPPPPPSSSSEAQPQSQSKDDIGHCDNPVVDAESNMLPTITNSNQMDNESELINLYGDVEEELDRNYNMYQQSINVRNSRPPPPMDKYHLYNNQMESSASGNYRSYDQHHLHTQQNNNAASISFNRPRMNHPHNVNYPRNQFQPRTSHMPYFPNRSTNFRPKNNYNMFN